MNVLLSFAQFEREMISERTRDKIAAARRKGKWVGGGPILGYDVKDTKLVVNEPEAERVREIFNLYLENESLMATVRELNRRGWPTKRWETKRQTIRGGSPFVKGRLYDLLRNVAYIGKVRYKSEVHPGEHEAIVDEAVFLKVQATFRRNKQDGGGKLRNKYGALLRGIMRCGSCDCSMLHVFTSRPNNRRYRYYVCRKAQQQGWTSCPAPSLSAPDIERFVVDQMKHAAGTPTVLRATLEKVRQESHKAVQRLERERRDLQIQLKNDDIELRALNDLGENEANDSRRADILERISLAERRMTQVATELVPLLANSMTEDDVAAAIADFGRVWDALSIREQVRIVELLIEQVQYDGVQKKVAITFRPLGNTSVPGASAKREEATR